jgi:antitoxin VapB
MYILWYMASKQPFTPKTTARIGWNNRTQVVTMPLEFRFSGTVREVFIRKQGESVILTPRPTDWSGFFAVGKASSDFMADPDRLPVQERSF